MRFRAQLQAMAKSEILAMIPPYMLERIKERDPKPLFKAFVIGHEGDVKATLVGIGKVVKTWFKDAVGKLSRKIWAGMELFNGHQMDGNYHDGREQIGEVAGSRAQDVNGKFSAVIAAYIYPEFKNLPLDVASIEANVEVDSADGEIHAINVGEVTAIALGNSKVDTPGFPDATLLGEIQAFVKKEIQFTKKGEGNMNIADIREAIKAENLKPSDIFGLGELTKDPMVTEAIEEEKSKAITGEYKNRKRDSEGFDKTKEKLETDHLKEMQEKDKRIKELLTETLKTKSTELFDSKIKERKLSDKAAKYVLIQKEKRFNPEDADKLNKDVDDFIDSEVDDFKKISEEEVETEEKKTPGGEPSVEGDDSDFAMVPD